MALVMMIKADNTVATTSKRTIMQKEKLVNTLRVVTARYYNDYDMENFQLVFSYVTPISRAVRTGVMTLTTDSYDGLNDTLVYDLSVDTGITAENGDVQIQFMFTSVELDPDTGENIQRVRMIEETTLHVSQTADWLITPDGALNDLAEIYLRNQQMLNALQAVADQLYSNNVSDVTIDADTIKLINAAGESVGNGITLEQLNDQLVEVGGETSGNVNVISI